MSTTTEISTPPEQSKEPTRAHYRVEGFFLDNPKPQFREGMPKLLFISSFNGQDLFVEENGVYRVSTEEEWQEERKAGTNLNKLPKPRYTPFPKKSK